MPSPTRLPAWTAAWRDRPPAGLFAPRAGIQAKLMVSQPGDQYEQEADRVADQAMRKPTTETNRAAGDNLHSDASSAINMASNNGGQPLDARIRALFEPHLGVGLSSVRVHTDAQAATSALAVSARAYTVGRDIVFGAGQYAPEMPQGRRLLAHELTHVAQQTSEGATGPALQRQAKDPGDVPLSIHEQINRALTWSSQPKWDQVYLLLNGLSMGDLLNELGNLKGMGYLDRLIANISQASGVFRERLLVAMYAVQGTTSSPEFKKYLGMLPTDQQAEIQRYLEASAAVAALGIGKPSLGILPGAPSSFATTPIPPAPNTSSSDMFDGLKKLIDQAIEGADVSLAGQKVNISIKGVTTTVLKSQGVKTEARVGWGDLILTTSYRNVYCTVDLWPSGDYRVSLTFPLSDSAVPDAARFTAIANEGQSAAIKIAQSIGDPKVAAALRKGDKDTLKQIFSPQFKRVKDLVTAAGDLASAKPGVSFGVEFGSGTGPGAPQTIFQPGGVPKPVSDDTGVYIRGVITVTF